MKLSKGQLLITGVYRSGTSYLTQLLNNHPRLAANMYVVNFMRFCFGRYDPINEKFNYTRLLFETAQRIYYRYGKKVDIFSILDQLNHETVSYAQIYDLLMSSLFLQGEKNIWAEKGNLVWTKIPEFLEMFPKGKALLIIRDPRNILLSFKKYTYTPEPAYLGAVFNCLDSMQKGQLYQQEFGKKHFKMICFEDLINNPAQILNEIFCFLELDIEHDLLSKEDWVDNDGKRWIHNSVFLKENDHTFNNEESINRWKTNLSDEEIAFCETILKQEMKAFGYTLSSIENNWKEIRAKLLEDEILAKYYKNWELNGTGIEAFPTDPLVRENWESERNKK